MPTAEIRLPTSYAYAQAVERADKALTKILEQMRKVCPQIGQTLHNFLSTDPTSGGFRRHRLAGNDFIVTCTATDFLHEVHNRRYVLTFTGSHLPMGSTAKRGDISFWIILAIGRTDTLDYQLLMHYATSRTPSGSTIRWHLLKSCSLHNYDQVSNTLVNWAGELLERFLPDILAYEVTPEVKS